MDDEKNVLTTIQAILQEDGFEVDIANDGKPAIEAIHARHYDLVLTDLKMPEVDGLAVLAEARKSSPNTVTMMMRRATGRSRRRWKRCSWGHTTTC